MNTILITESGYNDRTSYTDDSPIQVTKYTAAVGGDWSYDVDTGDFAFTSGSGDYDKEFVDIRRVAGGKLYDAYFDTINLYFSKEEIESNNMTLYVKVINSLSGIRMKHTPDSNYIFTPESSDDNCGHEEETGSFGNEEVRFMGSKQVSIRQADTDVRDSKSIKFRIESDLTSGVDEFIIASIDFLGSGDFSEGER